MPRSAVIKQCSALLQGGLTHYGKPRGLVVNYTQDRNGYETVMIHSFKATQDSMSMGGKFFSELKMFDIPIEKV